MEQLLEQMRVLMGDALFLRILNPQTNRPYIFRNFKRGRTYKQLSGGERVLVHLAYDIYNGSGKSDISTLNHLDNDSRIRVLNCLQTFLQVPRL